MHDHANHIFDRTPIGMRHWNVHVCSESVVQSAVQLANRRTDSYMYIPVSHTNGRSIKNTIGMVVNRLVGIWVIGSMSHVKFKVTQQAAWWSNESKYSKPKNQ